MIKRKNKFTAPSFIVTLIIVFRWYFLNYRHLETEEEDEKKKFETKKVYLHGSLSELFLFLFFCGVMSRKGHGGLCKAPTKEEGRKRKAKR